MLAALLHSRLRANVLAWLLSRPDERFFVRQLKSVLHEDATNLGRELARLERLGILTCQVEGRQKYYQADRRCPIFSELHGLVLKTSGLADILREALEPLARRIRVAFIHGSQARGTTTARSDVDLMVVGDVTFGRVVSALASAQERLGREVNPTVYPAAEFRKKLAAGHHFVRTVLGDPKIFLIGDERALAGLGKTRVARSAEVGGHLLGAAQGLASRQGRCLILDNESIACNVARPGPFLGTGDKSRRRFLMRR